MRSISSRRFVVARAWWERDNDMDYIIPKPVPLSNDSGFRDVSIGFWREGGTDSKPRANNFLMNKTWGSSQYPLK